MSLSIGQVFHNRYRIEALLGQGGFGAVYRALDLNLEETVAIKESFESSPAAEKQFQLEARLLFRLVHPGLPRVHDTFVIPGQGMYLVMDCVAGDNLETLLERNAGPLPVAQTLAWIDQVCQALNYLHTQSPPVIHRDIKPANIRVTADGRAMLVDFGIAKLYDPLAATTQAARAVTRGFSPPEQYGLGATDARSDIYALGATLYCLLTNRTPPDSVDRMVGKMAVLPAATAINPAVPEVVSQAIVKAMALDREQRWGSVEEFRQALAAAQPVPAAHTVMVAPAAATAAYQTRPAPAALGRAPVAPTVSSGGEATARAMGEHPVYRSRLILVGLLLFGLLLGAAALGILAYVFTQSKPADQPPASPQAGETWVSPTDGMEMIFIPPGSFWLGSNPAGDSAASESEQPQREVVLDGYWLDKTEITNAMFARFIEENGYLTEAEKQAGAQFLDLTLAEPDWRAVRGADWKHPHGPNSSITGLEQHPVVQVSWTDAAAYCAWRGARLPTEAEWERAARGTEQRLYAWGNQKPGSQRTNTADRNLPAPWADQTIDDGYQFTSPVGAYPSGATPDGFMDLTGNVLEWVADWYDPQAYQYLTAANPSGPASGETRVLCGGSWYNSGDFLRAANRGYRQPAESTDGIGFRCARAAVGSTLPTQASGAPDTSTPVPSPGTAKQPQPSGTPAAATALPTSLPATRLPATRLPLPTVTFTLMASQPAALAAGSASTSPVDGMQMSFIPAGSFWMGAITGDGNAHDDEFPQHEVYLDDFWIDRTEITNRLYTLCVEAGACTLPLGASETREVYYYDPVYADYPVIWVTWEQAQAYCAWAGRRLPTEAEWEKAARGGLDRKLYPWGDQAPTCDRANHQRCLGDTQQVGSYPANGYGLFDLGGNVSEWVQDWYAKGYYPDSPAQNPAGPDSGMSRVTRDASWWSLGNYLRVSERSSMKPATRDSGTGFRCAR